MKKKFSLIWLIYKHGIEKYFYKNFKLYAPSVAGSSNLKGRHTIKTIKLIFPLFLKLILILNIKPKIISIKAFYKNKNETKKLKKLLDFYGSDKAKIHNYHLIYSSIFLKKLNVKKILEIGLGTNNENLLSNMGKEGKPGASLRAFRDYFKNAKIYGADIDKEILFSELKIKTAFVDQINQKSMEQLFKKFGSNFDLIIDDGMHSPLANIIFLITSIKHLKKGGCLVIEDISPNSLIVWKIISGIMSSKFKNNLIKSKTSYVFILYK